MFCFRNISSKCACQEFLSFLLRKMSRLRKYISKEVSNTFAHTQKTPCNRNCHGGTVDKATYAANLIVGLTRRYTWTTVSLMSQQVAAAAIHL